MNHSRHHVRCFLSVTSLLLASPAWAGPSPGAPATSGASAAAGGNKVSAAEQAAKRRAAAVFTTNAYASDGDFQQAVASIRNELQAEIKAGVPVRQATVSGMVTVTRWKIPTEAEIRQKHERTVENGVNRTVYTVSDYQVDDRNKRVTFSLATSEQSRPPRIFLFGNEVKGLAVHQYIDMLLNGNANNNTDLDDGGRVQLPPDMQQLLKNLLASMPGTVKNTVVANGKTLALTEMGDILVSNLSTIQVVEADSNLGVQTHGNGFSAKRYSSASIGGDLVIDGQTYDVIATQLISPIALDLDHNGRIDVTGLATGGVRYDRNSRFVEAGSVLFDLLGNGAPVRCEWLKPGRDGLLVDDSAGAVTRAASRDGRISGLHLFGGQRDGNGYAKLARTHGRELRMASLDRPGIGWRQAAGYGPIRGASLASLKVWQDANADGRVQTTELRTCAELGITAINAEYDLVGDERETRMVSWFEQDGKRHLSEDVWFAVAPGDGAAAAPASKGRR